jgi:transcriptional regulator with XRE-family HTH domain
MGSRTPRHRRSDVAILATILRELRRDAGFTQTELATRLGRSQEYVSRYERGVYMLDLFELAEVCRAVGAPFLGVMERID